MLQRQDFGVTGCYMKKNYDKQKTKKKEPVYPQYQVGYEAFFSKTQRLKRVGDATVIVTACPYRKYTMGAREWQRGYDNAYFDNLEKLHDSNRRR